MSALKSRAELATTQLADVCCCFAPELTAFDRAWQLRHASDGIGNIRRIASQFDILFPSGTHCLFDAVQI